MGNAFVLIVIGLLLMYAVISDKFYCLEGCFSCLAGRTGDPTLPGASGSLPGLPTLPGASGGSSAPTRTQLGGLLGQ